MPIDPARFARIRSRLLAGLALTAAGTASAACGGSSSQPTVNEPAEHVNVPPDGEPSAAPSGLPEVPSGTHVNTPEEAAKHVNTPPTPAPTTAPSAKP